MGIPSGQGKIGKQHLTSSTKRQERHGRGTGAFNTQRLTHQGISTAMDLSLPLFFSTCHLRPIMVTLVQAYLGSDPILRNIFHVSNVDESRPIQ
jgi:hypothetical protein